MLTFQSKLNMKILIVIIYRRAKKITIWSFLMIFVWMINVTLHMTSIFILSRIFSLISTFFRSTSFLNSTTDPRFNDPRSLVKNKLRKTKEKLFICCWSCDWRTLSCFAPRFSILGNQTVKNVSQRLMEMF